jgi:RTA1 like protein
MAFDSNRMVGVNAFAYMLLGRMVHFYLPEKKLCGFKAPSLAKYFVCLDILSFIVQGIGGSMISPGADQKTIMNGIHVYMGGIGLQELFILIFLSLVVTFHRKMRVLAQGGEVLIKEGWKRLTWVLYVVLALISVRADLPFVPPPSFASLN